MGSRSLPGAGRRERPRRGGDPLSPRRQAVGSAILSETGPRFLYPERLGLMSRTRRVLGLGHLALGLLVFPLGGLSVARAQESWDAVYMGGKKVGFIHTYVTPVKDRGRQLFRVRV